jgi:hypothetical protein
LENPYAPSKASLTAVDVPPPQTQEALRQTESQTDDIPTETTDFVRVATCGTPTEAYLLKGVLEANGLSPSVADANIVQANTWMTQAVGGVRVLVPAGQAEAALRAIAEYNAGAFELEDEETKPPVRLSELKSPVFSPDRATLLSFFLTPAFGSALQLANTISIGTPKQKLLSWLWFFLLSVTSVAAIAFMHRVNPGPFIVFRASIAISAITVSWYFLSVQPQTKYLISTYGRKYKQRSITPLSLPAGALLLAAGWLLTEFA